MRKILAAVALTGAAFGVTTQPAAASGCYGAQGIATACYQGEAGVDTYNWYLCVYTGSTTCTNYELPFVTYTLPTDAEVCVWPAECVDVI